MLLEDFFPTVAYCAACGRHLTKENCHELFSITSGWCKPCDEQMQREDEAERLAIERGV